jgi:hypothetical protein
MTIPQAAGIPKGRPAAARYVSELIEQRKASGFVAATLMKYGLGPDDARSLARIGRQVMIISSGQM